MFIITQIIFGEKKKKSKMVKLMNSLHFELRI